MTTPIVAAVLCRDDSATLEACLQSVRPHVDGLVVVDTGSVDNSPDIARRYADRFDVFLSCNDPATEQIEDFALARNHALSLIGPECAQFWIDADDVLVGGEHLRTLIAQRPAETAQWLIPYEYEYDNQGRVICLHQRENLAVPAKNFTWQVPVHEVLMPKPGVQVVTMPPTTLVKRMHRKHLSAKAPDPQRNLRILRKYVGRVVEGDVRALYYFGVELSRHGEWGKALMTLRRYIELSNWHDEKCLAHFEVARIYQQMGDFESAIDWALKSMVVKAWPEPYWVLAECFYELARQGVETDYNIRRAAHFAQLGLTIPEADTVLFVNPMKRFEVRRILADVLLKLGNVEGALEACQKGLEGLPGDEFLTGVSQLCETELSSRSVMSGLDKLHQYGKLPPQSAQMIAHLLKGGSVDQLLPPAPSAPPAPQLKEPGYLDIVFFVGYGLEPWNPQTLMAGGMGGSETMVWELSRRLRKLGHRVRVFGQCAAGQEGLFEGVEWLDSSRYAGTECDVLISSRQPAAIDDEFQVKAGCRLLYVHDVHCGEALDTRRALRFDRVLALSEWHREVLAQVYPFLPKEKIHQTRNGVDPKRFAIDVERNPHKVIYSSSPDRGLHTLLECWPAIRAEVPDAELHVFYGMDNIEKTIAATNDAELSTLLRRIKHLARTLPGVFLRGRVNQEELAREMLGAGVWGYPTGFTETSCIGAAEAQSAGLYIVSSALAALAETVSTRGVLLDGFIPDHRAAQPESYKAAFVAEMVKALRGEWERMSREDLQLYARANFNLDSLAEQWDRMLRGVLLDVKDNVVPAFKGAA